jgi:hypothetical protein
MENEILQAELNPMKIDEPKTPYRSPLCTDEESELDEESSKSAVDQADEDVIPQESLARPYELRDDTRRRRSVDEYYNTGNIPEDEMLGEEDDLEEQEDEEAKKKQFLEARKMHYKISRNILYVVSLANSILFAAKLSC